MLKSTHETIILKFQKEINSLKRTKKLLVFIIVVNILYTLWKEYM